MRQAPNRRFNPVDNIYVFIAGNQTWAFRWNARFPATCGT